MVWKQCSHNFYIFVHKQYFARQVGEVSLTHYLHLRKRNLVRYLIHVATEHGQDMYRFSLR